MKKVAVCVQQIMLIAKEVVIDESLPIDDQIIISVLPTDRPVVKQIIDIFDEEGKLIISYGRD